MWSILERLKKIIIIAVLSIIPLVLLYVQSKDEEIRHVVSWPIVELSGFIERGTLFVSGYVSDAFFRYCYMASRADELRQLRAEVLETRALKARVLDLINDRSHSAELAFNYAEAGFPNGTLARVIARAGAPMARMVRLDRGHVDGIKPYSPVVGHGGVVGQVLSVASHFSDVLLITDASSAIDAKVVGSEARGLLRGMTNSDEYLMEIRDIDGLSLVKPGDIVVTSGLNSNFPHGVPVGTVRKSARSRDGLTVTARVEPLVNIDRLGQVLVLDTSANKATQIERYKALWPLAVQ